MRAMLLPTIAFYVYHNVKEAVGTYFCASVLSPFCNTSIGLVLGWQVGMVLLYEQVQYIYTPPRDGKA